MMGKSLHKIFLHAKPTVTRLWDRFVLAAEFLCSQVGKLGTNLAYRAAKMSLKLNFRNSRALECSRVRERTYAEPNFEFRMAFMITNQT